MDEQTGRPQSRRTEPRARGQRPCSCVSDPVWQPDALGRAQQWHDRWAERADQLSHSPIPALRRSQRLALTQGFVLSVAQARAAGLTSAQLRSLVRRRIWSAPRRAVLAVLDPGTDAYDRAALAAAAANLTLPESVASHESAAIVWGLPVLSVPARPIVTGAPGRFGHVAAAASASSGARSVRYRPLARRRGDQRRPDHRGSGPGSPRLGADGGRCGVEGGVDRPGGIAPQRESDDRLAGQPGGPLGGRTGGPAGRIAAGIACPSLLAQGRTAGPEAAGLDQCGPGQGRSAVSRAASGDRSRRHAQVRPGSRRVTRRKAPARSCSNGPAIASSGC